MAAAHDNAMAQAELGRALDRTLLRGVQSITLGLALLYAALAIVKPFVLAGGSPPVSHGTIATLTAFEVLMAAGFAALHATLRWRQTPSQLAHPVAGLITATLLTDSVLHMLLLPKPLESLSFMLISLGVAFFYFSPPWFAGAQVTIVAAWALSAWCSPAPEIRSVASPWVDLSLSLFEALVLSSIIFGVRLRDRVRLERLLWSDARLQDELARANRELEAFSYSVSHDLRAPVRAIDGYARAVQELHAGTLHEQAAHFIDEIRRAGGRMNALIDDQLELARVTRADMVRVRVDLSALCAELLAELRIQEPQRAVEAHIEPRLEVPGDPGLLRLAFANLLGNAWKYTARRPLAHITVTSSQTAWGQEITVRDDGVGFDPAHASRLFTPFSRLHADDAFPGTGIGLAIVQRIAQRHGGMVRAEASPNAGATFTLVLPRDRDR